MRVGRDSGFSTWISIPDLDFIANLEHAMENRTTGDAAFEVINLGTGLVDVKGPDDHHVRRLGKVPDGDGQGRDGIENGINVELELRANGDDRRILGNSVADEFLAPGVSVGQSTINVALILTWMSL